MRITAMLLAATILLGALSGCVEQDKRTAQAKADEVSLYGCILTQEYDPPFNAMSQDWTPEQLDGFYYHELSPECQKRGGDFPAIAQAYTYTLCRQYGVSYELTFAIFEAESGCRWDHESAAGKKGYAQLDETAQQARMERLGLDDLLKPSQNIYCFVDYFSELQKTFSEAEALVTAYDEELNAESVLSRAEELKEDLP